MFDLCGNIAGITTPIVIGYPVQKTGTSEYALVYGGVTALIAICELSDWNPFRYGLKV